MSRGSGTTFEYAMDCDSAVGQQQAAELTSLEKLHCVLVSVSRDIEHACSNPLHRYAVPNSSQNCIYIPKQSVCFGPYQEPCCSPLQKATANSQHQCEHPRYTLQMRPLVVHLLFIHADRGILLLPPHRLDRTVMQLLQRLHNSLVSTCCHGLHMLTFIISDIDKHIVQCTAAAKRISVTVQPAEDHAAQTSHWWLRHLLSLSHYAVFLPCVNIGLTDRWHTAYRLPAQYFV